MSALLSVQGPMPAALLIWRPAPARWAVTVAVKATFAVQGGAVELAHEQLPLGSEDLAPFKPRVDATLVGSASGLVVGAVSKRLRADFDPEQTVADDRMLALPQLKTIELTKVAETPRLGPLPLILRMDQARLDREHRRWAEQLCRGPGDDGMLVMERPAPPGFDFSIFNGAPRELQLDELAPGTHVIAEGLEEGPMIELDVPVLAPRVTRGGEPLRMRLDTLTLDADGRRCVLIWRAIVDSDDPEREIFGVASGPSFSDLPAETLDLYSTPIEHALQTTQEVEASSLRASALPFGATPSAPELARDASLPVDRFVAASIAIEADPPRRDAILRGLDLTPASFVRLERRFHHAVEAERTRGADELQRAIANARETAARAPAEEMTVADYAFVTVSVERGEIQRVLATLNVALADLMRIQQAWRRRLKADPTLRAQVDHAVTAERRTRLRPASQ